MCLMQIKILITPAPLPAKILCWLSHSLVQTQKVYEVGRTCGLCGLS